MSNLELICSFCGKSESEVEYIVPGPAVYICTECILLAHEIARQQIKERLINKMRKEIFAELWGTD